MSNKSFQQHIGYLNNRATKPISNTRNNLVRHRMSVMELDRTQAGFIEQETRQELNMDKHFQDNFDQEMTRKRTQTQVAKSKDYKDR